MLRISTDADLPTAAMRFANLGIPVFPCVPGGKQPLTPNGFHDASSSARTVDAWWRRTPDANIGLPTGAASGVLVVDVDVHPSGSGFEAFERARAAQLADGWGWLVRTPSGGLHAYYPSPAEAEQRSWQVPSAHVDFRGDGGYVIVPPSRVAAAGQPSAYRVIAVAQHQPRPIDARSLRRVPRAAAPDAAATVAARARQSARQAGRLGRESTRGRAEPRPVLGRVPDGRGRAPLRHDAVAARRRGPLRRTARSGGGDDDPLGVPDRFAPLPCEPPGPYDHG